MTCGLSLYKVDGATVKVGEVCTRLGGVIPYVNGAYRRVGRAMMQVGGAVTRHTSLLLGCQPCTGVYTSMPRR